MDMIPVEVSRRPQVRSPEVGKKESGPFEVDSVEADSLEVGVNQVGPPEVGPEESGFYQEGVDCNGVAQVRALEAGALDQGGLFLFLFPQARPGGGLFGDVLVPEVHERPGADEFKGYRNQIVPFAGDGLERDRTSQNQHHRAEGRGNENQMDKPNAAHFPSSQGRLGELLEMDGGDHPDPQKGDVHSRSDPVVYADVPEPEDRNGEGNGPPGEEGGDSRLEVGERGTIFPQQRKMGADELVQEPGVGLVVEGPPSGKTAGSLERRRQRFCMYR